MPSTCQALQIQTLILLPHFTAGGGRRGEVLAQAHAGWKWLRGIRKAGLDYSEIRGLYSKRAPENITSSCPHCLCPSHLQQLSDGSPIPRSLPLQSLSNHGREDSCSTAGIIIVLFCSAPFMVSLCPLNADVLAWHLRLSL